MSISANPVDTTQPNTSARAAAARLNGAKGRGPITEEGKERSSRNACKHGLSSEKELVIAIDPVGEFLPFQTAMFEHHAPTDPMQTMLVDRIISCSWRLRRIAAMDAALLGFNAAQGKGIAFAFVNNGYQDRFLTLSRYETAIERSLYRAINALAALKAEEAKKESSSDPTNRAATTENPESESGPRTPDPAPSPSAQRPPNPAPHPSGPRTLTREFPT